jgi:hypothetical protein
MPTLGPALRAEQTIHGRMMQQEPLDRYDRPRQSTDKERQTGAPNSGSEPIHSGADAASFCQRPRTARFIAWSQRWRKPGYGGWILKIPMAVFRASQ